MMNHKKHKNPEIVIDENSLVPAPSVFQRIMFSVYAVIIGVVLAQVFLWSMFRFSTFLTGNSVVLLFSNNFFQAYVIVCAVFGWVSGKRFLEWVIDKIDYWWNIW